jgi:mRNA interferase MazF
MRGDVIVIAFPYSENPTKSKRRPALILADLPGDDIICAAITSSGKDPAGISLSNTDFEQGGIHVESTIRASKLVTLTKDQIEKVAGRVKEEKRMQVVKKIYDLMT